MRKTFAVSVIVLCALILCASYRLKTKLVAAKNVAPTQQMVQVPAPARPESPSQPVMADTVTPSGAADTNTNNGLITLRLNTEFSGQKPSPEAAKNALAINTWMQKQHGTQ